MDNRQSIHKFFQKKEQLTLKNERYKTLVHELFSWLLKSDNVEHDLTTEKLFSNVKKSSKALVLTRNEATIAALEEIEYFIKTFTHLSIKLLCNDGDQLQKGQKFIEIEGDIKEILAYERVMLNILQRICGIATDTHAIVNQMKIDKPFVAATRKTIWGLLDKKAVAMGGGMTHRLDLSDGILVKDNHLMLISETDALKKLLQTVTDTLIEIEVEDEEHLKNLVSLFMKEQTTNVLAVLLDNFTPENAKKILSTIERHSNLIFEASGGINKTNINAWAEAGVDIISLGALTHSPKAADVSLEIEA